MTALTDVEIRAINKHLISHNKQPLAFKTVLSYSKVIVNGRNVQSQAMTRAKRSNSYTVMYSDGTKVSYGLVDKILKCEQSNVAVINKLEISKTPSLPCLLPSIVASRLLEDFSLH